MCVRCDVKRDASKFSAKNCCCQIVCYWRKTIFNKNDSVIIRCLYLGCVASDAMNDQKLVTFHANHGCTAEDLPRFSHQQRVTAVYSCPTVMLRCDGLAHRGERPRREGSPPRRDVVASTSKSSHSRGGSCRHCRGEREWRTA
jgi:hypothetical protein